MFTSHRVGRSALAVGLLLPLLAVLFLPTPSAAQCDAHWSSQFTIDGFSDPVRAIIEFDDDGPGPHEPTLIVGGDFVEVGGVVLNRVGAWNGSAWVPMGSGFNGSVECFHSFDPDGDGPVLPTLFAGGGFTQSGDTGVAWIAQWTGSAWVAVGNAATALGFSVHALVTFDLDRDGPQPPRLVAAGRFGGHVAYLVGNTWLIPGGLPNDDVYAAVVFDEDGEGPSPPAVFFGGSFTSAGGGPCSKVARWNGAVFTPVGTGLLNRFVWCLAPHDPDGPGPLRAILVAGCHGQTDAGASVPDVARWDGASWQEFGSNINGDVLTLHSFTGAGDAPPRLFAGGLINGLSGTSSFGILQLVGDTWTNVDHGTNQYSYVIRSFDPDGSGPLAPRVILGGDFMSASGVECQGLATWDGSVFAPVGPSRNAGFNDLVNAAAVFDDDGLGPHRPLLYLGGRFTRAGGVPASRLAIWDGHAFSAFTTVSNGISALAALDLDGDGPLPTELIVGGGFSNIGGTSVGGVAAYNGTGWRRVGTGSPFNANSFIMFDADGAGPGEPVLYLAGSANSGGYLRRLVGGAWTTVPGGPDRDVLDMAVFDFDGAGPNPPELVVGGSFSRVGSQNIPYVARFNGTTWSAVGLAVGGAVSTLTSYDPDGPGPVAPSLFIGGSFNRIGTTTFYGIARWSGSAWVTVGNLNNTNLNVSDMTVFDDDGPGPGLPALHVVGSFSGYLFGNPGITFTNILRWNGAAWQTLDRGINVVPYKAVSFESDSPAAPALMVVGRNTTAGTARTPSAFIASWSRGAGIGITAAPASSTASRCGDAAFSVRARASAPLTYQWQRAGVDLLDGPTPSGSVILGADSPSLTLSNVQPGDAGRYACVVSTACGSELSSDASLTICPADYDCDGEVASPDFMLFVQEFFALAPSADVNADGFVNSQDFFDFLAVFFGGC